MVSPRDYQIELFERAKERNIIAVLDTGSRVFALCFGLLTDKLFANQAQERLSSR